MRHFFAFAVAYIVFAFAPSTLARPSVDGAMRQWQPVTISFEGPHADESPETFRDYRLDVTFEHGDRSFTVPGYFAADGDAANTSAVSGNVWRVRWTPDAAGQWRYRVSFRVGHDVAASNDPDAGEPGVLDGLAGSFDIAEADPAAPGFYAKGQLRYVGEHYLQHAGSGEFFVKAGPGSPEDFLGYADFDGTFDNGGSQDDSALGEDGLHNYEPHVRDWRPGDPTWRGGKGKGIIGALNYLHAQGCNTIYNVLLTVNGDANTTWPWVEPGVKDVYDVSKLEQWDIVFTHMDRLGINHDSYLSESENVRYLNNNQLGSERIIYYRELNARFAYHLSWRWNVGEEPHGIKPGPMMPILEHLNAINAYGHPVGHHCSGKKQLRYPVYEPQLGNPHFQGCFAQINEDYHVEVLKWVRASAQAGHKWVVPLDEPNKILPGEDDKARVGLWKVLMAGGEGMGLYTAYELADYSDITIEDFRRLESIWQQMRHGVSFFQRPDINPHLPKMATQDGLLSRGYCFAEPGTLYVLYTRDARGLTLDLSGADGVFSVRWYDPTRGGDLREGSVPRVNGGAVRGLGSPPNDQREWVLAVSRVGIEGEPSADPAS